MTPLLAVASGLLALLAPLGVPTSAGVAGPATTTTDLPTTWTRVGAGQTGGISGMAPAPNGWLVVRDNKTQAQNRIALLGTDGVLTPLDWPGERPVDLESVDAVPGQAGRYVAVTSTGRATELDVTGQQVVVRSSFALPLVSSGVEGFALTRVGGVVVAVWATRGSTTAPARVFAATWSPVTHAFGTASTVRVRVPFPTTDVRQVSDIELAAGRLVVTSTSDPGSSGPFSSAVTDVGSLTVTGGQPRLRAQPPVVRGTVSGHKVEGFVCDAAGSVLASDDETLGGWVVRSAITC